MKKAVFLLLLTGFLVAPLYLYAEEISESYVTTELAKVISIELQEERPVPGTDVRGLFQTLRAEILEGENAGAVVIVQNDYLKLNTGEKFYALHTVDTVTNTDTYAVSEPYRLDSLYFLLGLFVVAVFILGGKQGIRGLLALVISFCLIGYVLLPGILGGVSPLLVILGVTSLIVILGSYITHGFNRVTTSAVIGMVITLAITALLAHFSVIVSRLSGFVSDEAVYLNLNTGGTIDFSALLLGGILIGLLGVLYDAAIGQAVSVDEISHAAPEASRKELFSRAMRIGREHIGALVNTLAIAYVGVALPLLLLFYSVNSDSSILITLNREVFANEIVRMVVGSIGIMLAVPITTLVAVLRAERK
ncbi:YibE/F family protein [Patescibacteria group bacterium]|nr:YibE/F family protein [Patescibacteria group bacterium]